MFTADVYRRRRQRLRDELGTGMILFLGHAESPMNAPDNCYWFRQDSSFLYFWGIDRPGLSAVIDADSGEETIFGDDPTLDEQIWTGPEEALAARCLTVGVDRQRPRERLDKVVADAVKRRRPIHYLPPYRMDETVKLADLLGMDQRAVAGNASVRLIRAVVRLRSVKGAAEIAELETALAVNHAMQTTAMQMSAPGCHEREVVGAIEGIAYSRTGRKPPFTTICSIRGAVLHNRRHEHRMQAGDLVLCDCGAESPLGYACDTTRTFPVSGRFSERQREIYEIVLRMQDAALEAMRPGVPFKTVHLVAARRLVEDLKSLDLLCGEVDGMVENGVFALVFPHGLGHMLGLDVHDMEGLGEDHVGYTDAIRRDPRCGLNRLRLAKPLAEGFVVTVEPGVYFIPPLIAQWRRERRFVDQIAYDKLDAYRAVGGVRIEDDVLVTGTGARVLGPGIPKTVAAVENCCRQRPPQ